MRSCLNRVCFEGGCRTPKRFMLHADAPIFRLLGCHGCWFELRRDHMPRNRGNQGASSKILMRGCGHGIRMRRPNAPVSACPSFLLPASRCHTAPARNASPRARWVSEPDPPRIYSDFAGSGVDTPWAVQFRAVPDPAGFCLGRCVVRALSTAHAGNDPHRRKSASGPATGRQGAAEIRVYDSPSWNPTRPSLHPRRRRHRVCPAGATRDRATRGRGTPPFMSRSPSGSGRGTAGTCRASRPGPPR